MSVRTPHLFCSRPLVPRLLTALSVAAMVGCTSGDATTSRDAGSPPAGDASLSEGEPQDGAWRLDSNLDEVVLTYADVVLASYTDSLELAIALQDAIDEFVADPDESKLDAARASWRAAREPYLQTEVYRFYSGPIDNDVDGPEALLNAWPLDEAHIDYVSSGRADSGEEATGDAGVTEGRQIGGLVNDRDFELTAEHLVAQNERGGEKNIAIGYHAVEFLLWGQDFDPDGPGQRPATDYLEGDGASAPNGDRRGEYLALCAELLVGSLEQLVEAWAPGVKGNYRADFIAGGEESLQKVLTGMIVLSGFETGGDRLQAALDALDQEEEHSCFSDNTHRDMVGDIIGVRNVWSGRYAALDGTVVQGPGIGSLVEDADPDLADALDRSLARSLKLAEALRPPFDQEIAPGNSAGHARVQALIDSLFEQEQLLSEVFRGYGFAVPQPQ